MPAFFSRLLSLLTGGGPPAPPSPEALLDQLGQELEQANAGLAAMRQVAARMGDRMDARMEEALLHEEEAVQLLEAVKAGTLTLEEAEPKAQAALARKAEAEALRHEEELSRQYQLDLIAAMESRITGLEARLTRLRQELASLVLRGDAAAKALAMQQHMHSLSTDDPDALTNYLDAIERQMASHEMLRDDQDGKATR